MLLRTINRETYRRNVYEYRKRWDKWDKERKKKKRKKKNGSLDVARTFNRLYTPWYNYEIHFCRSRYVTCFNKDGKRERG